MAELNWNLLDTTIPNKIATSYFDERDNALARQGQMQGQQMNALALQKAQQEMKDSEAMRGVASQSGGDVDKMIEGYYGAGKPEVAMKLEELKKKRAEEARTGAVEKIKILGPIAKQLKSSENPEAAWATVRPQLMAMFPDAKDLEENYQDAAPHIDQISTLYDQLNPGKFTVVDGQWVPEKPGGAAQPIPGFTPKPKNETDLEFYKRDPKGFAAYKAAGRKAEDGSTKAPSGYKFKPDGTLMAITGGPGDKKQAGKPLPTAALKLQQEELDAIGTTSSIQSDLDKIKSQVDTGELKLGPIKNIMSSGLNAAGISTADSRKYATLKASLEKLRNDSLRLNKGVQTEGDAIRAWNEILANINDPKLVSDRLAELKVINERAKNIRSLNVENIRNNYGLEQLDLSGYTNQPPAPGAASGQKVNAKGGIAHPDYPGFSIGGK